MKEEDGLTNLYDPKKGNNLIESYPKYCEHMSKQSAQTITFYVGTAGYEKLNKILNQINKK